MSHYRGAGSSHQHARMNAIPTSVLNSPDWRARATFDAAAWFARPGYPDQCWERFKLLRHTVETPRSLDLAYSRRGNEDAYVQSLGELVRRFEREDRGFRAPREAILLQTVRRMTEHGQLTGHESMDDHIFRPSVQLRSWERRMRHGNQCFVAYHQREVLSMRSAAIPELYPRCPSWWAEYEVPYGFLPELPPVVSYLGLSMLTNAPEWMWDVFLVEWVRECAFELIYQARQGRLWWLPPAIIHLYNHYGVGFLFASESESVRDELKGLLYEISAIRWLDVPVVQRKLPREIGPFCPVYASGDWVAFDPVNWETTMEDYMYLNELDIHPEGFASGRGSRLRGLTSTMVQEDAPDGREAEQARDNPWGYRIQDRYGLSKNELSKANSSLRKLGDQLGLTAAVRDRGIPFAWDIRDVVKEITKAVRGEAAFGWPGRYGEAARHGAMDMAPEPEQMEVIPEIDVSAPLGQTEERVLGVQVVRGPAQLTADGEDMQDEGIGGHHDPERELVLVRGTSYRLDVKKDEGDIDVIDLDQ